MDPWISTIMPFIIAFFVAWRARQMGYRSISWFFVSILTSPLVALGFLAALPNRTIRKKRREDMELLEKQLARRGLLVEKNRATPLPRYTIDEKTTIGELSDVGRNIIYSIAGAPSQSEEPPNKEILKSETEVESIESSPLEAKPLESSKKKLSQNQIFGIGCGIVALLSASLFVITCLSVLFLLVYLGREPENLFVEVEYPWVVDKGDEFEFVLNIRNTGDTALTVGDIDLDVMFSDSILDGAIVVRTDPSMERDYSVPGVKTFRYNHTIPPGEKRQVTFFLKASTPGEFGGPIDVFTGSISSRTNAAITITPK